MAEDNENESSVGGVPSRVFSKKVTKEDWRAAIEEARFETDFLFHLTDGHISHIRNEESRTRRRRRRS